jgi:hypothetical protein
VANTYQPTWESIGIADALSLSLSPLEKDENLPKTIGYFWSDALNCFLFGHSPMTPTLLDVMIITGLDISSTCPSAYRLSENPFKLSSKAECTNWGAYLNQHLKTKGPVTEKEHTAFLNLWLEHFSSVVLHLLQPGTIFLWRMSWPKVILLALINYSLEKFTDTFI